LTPSSPTRRSSSSTSPPGTGIWRLNQAIAILQANQLPLPVDYAFAGEFYGPSAFGSKVTSAVTIAAGSPAWTAFPGFWGENEYFKVPPYGVVWLGTFSPVGPVYHAVWQHPLETLATWPSG
jgi:hypothetical protein